MKRTGVLASFFATASTTSTTGPHVLLWQNFGVANVTTNGSCRAIACATEMRYSRGSGCVAVDSSASLPPVLARVGVSVETARVPTAGAFVLGATTMFASPALGLPLPVDDTSSQYFATRGRLTCVTKMEPTPALAPPGTPIGSLCATAVSYGFAVRPVATKTFAVGVDSTRP